MRHLQIGKLRSKEVSQVQNFGKKAKKNSKILKFRPFVTELEWLN